MTKVPPKESVFPQVLLPKSILSEQTPQNDSSLQTMNKTALARSRTSAKCRLSRCSLFRILSISHCRSSIMDSRTDTRDSAVSTLLCNLENYSPKTGIQKNTGKNIRPSQKKRPYINTFYAKQEYKNEIVGSFNSSASITIMKTIEVYKNFHARRRPPKNQYIFYL